MDGYQFNPPPGWPQPPAGWTPPPGWKPDPSWPDPPAGWELWVPIDPPATAPPAGERIELPAPPEAPLPPPSADKTPHASAAEVDSLRAEVARLRAALAAARSDATQASVVVELDDERVLQEVGIYRYHHPLENAVQYRERLASMQEAIKAMITARTAILASDMFTYNNSLAQGRKMTADFSKLMLRAYNAEADNCVRALRAGNVVTAKARLERSVESIAKLGSMMEMRVNPDYHALRIQELELTADYLMKQQEEREAAREERERLREERRAEQELAAERARLDKEREHYRNALEALRAQGATDGVADMEQRLHDIDTAIEQNDYRVANIRAGYVYVISNPGAFGTHMVKIGMTRRLEPYDRIRELGDASVPFPFEVHALFFADDAVTVENDLHKAFADARVNRVNERREFFFATPAEARDVLTAKFGNLLEFVEHTEATQYLQSQKYWPAHIRTGPATQRD